MKFFLLKLCSYYFLGNVHFPFRYYQVSCVGSSPTAITWNDYRKTEILAAFANFDVRCYNVG